MQIAAGLEWDHLLPKVESVTDDRADIRAAVTWLAEHYAVNDRFARILLYQAAHQDGVTEAEVARRLKSELRDQARFSHTPTS